MVGGSKEQGMEVVGGFFLLYVKIFNQNPVASCKPALWQD